MAIRPFCFSLETLSMNVMISRFLWSLIVVMAERWLEKVKSGEEVCPAGIDPDKLTVEDYLHCLMVKEELEHQARAQQAWEQAGRPVRRPKDLR